MARDGGTVRGIWPVLEALRSGRVVERVLLRRGPLSDQLREVQQVARQTGVPIQLVPPERLDRATKGDHQGVVAFVSEVPVQDLDEVIAKAYEAGRTPLLLALDGVTDVRNIGAISRSAECFGADALIVPMAGSARLGPDAIKSSAGALMRLPVCRVGNLVKASLDAHDILAKEGIELEVVDMYSIRPIDREAIRRAACTHGVLLSAEEHNITGGFGAAVAEVIAEDGLACKLRHIGMPDQYSVLGPPTHLYRHYGLDGEGVAASVREALKG